MRICGVFFGVILLGCVGLLNAASAVDQGWPREIKDSRGTHRLDHPPKRIVSTSVTLTGSLLAIDAPVIASGSTGVNNPTADDQGFFRQWGDIARARGVAKLGRGETSVESIALYNPDLILLSGSGGDSALAFYEQLSALAPVLVVNYDDKSWQELLRQLSRITGQEPQAEARIAEFDRAFAAMKQRIVVQQQPVNALVWDIASQSAMLWTPESAQGQFLKAAGIHLAPLPAHRVAQANPGKRHDVIPLEGENLVLGLNGRSLLLFAADDKDRASLLASPLLGHLPAIASGQVYTLGPETFRLDYYSAMGLIKRLNALFATSGAGDKSVLLPRE